MKKEIVLAPIRETTEDFEALEKHIREYFRKELYVPLMRFFGRPATQLQNALEDLARALQTGRITFSRGSFSGKFNAAISKELRALGAKFDRKSSTWKIRQAELPLEIRAAVSASAIRFQEKVSVIDQKLSQIVPEEFAEKLKTEKFFDTALWKVDRKFTKQIEAITVAPQLSDEDRAKIAREWQNNMELWIKDFTKSEIKKLRSDMQASVFTGNRYESAISAIRKSYGVTANKAKFLARQETSLLMAKFKETRYSAAGVNEYDWTCVHAPKDKSPNQNTPGNVRYTHAILDGKRFRWDDPRELNKDGTFKAGGERKPGNNLNPGQDYNCRCAGKPVVRF